MMNNEKRLIVRSIRLTPSINSEIEQIAAYEDRTVSKTIQRLLDKAVHEYFDKLATMPDFKNFLSEYA